VTRSSEQGRSRAKKSLGQNFLRDDRVIDRIIGSLKLTTNDTVVEIGPGTGALTQKLVESAASVIAIEFDRDLIPQLNKQFGSYPTFKLISEDALAVDFGQILYGIENAKLVANLPYNISTPILQRLIDQRFLFSELVLMFQREVVDRITAVPGGKERGFLSVLVENAFDHERITDVAPDAFFPVPKVWSAVVRLVPKGSSVNDEVLFRRVVSMSFAQKRKTLLNNLKAITSEPKQLLDDAGIDGTRRAETLTLTEWVRLTESLAKKAG